MKCPICGLDYAFTRPTKWGGMEYHHAYDPKNVVCQQSSASYKAAQQNVQRTGLRRVAHEAFANYQKFVAAFRGKFARR